MSLWKYKYFVDVVESKSFTKAGKKNFVSQTAISQQISSLEKLIGGRLIERRADGIAVTGLGKIVYDKAKEMLYIYEEMSQEIEAMNEKKALRIGIDNSINKLFWLKVQDMLERYYQEDELQFFKLDYLTGSRMLEENTLDSYIGYDLNLPDKKTDFETFNITSSRIGVYIGSTAPFAEQGAISLQDLDGYTRYKTEGYPCSIQEGNDERLRLLSGEVKQEVNIDTMQLKADFNDGYAFVDSTYFSFCDGKVRLLDDYHAACTIKAFYKSRQKKDCIEEILKHLCELVNN